MAAAARAACRSGPGFGRSGTMGGDRVDTGRGPSMYEMEGPRPVSRHRPADFSASFAPFNHLPGPGTHPVARSRPDHRWLGSSPCRGSGFPLCRPAGVSPKPGGAKYFLSRWRRAFLLPYNRGFPQAEWPQVFPSPVAQSILLITQLGVSPPPYKLKFALCRVVPGFPRGQRPQCLPNTAGAGLPRDQRPQSVPITRWFGVSPAPVVPGFPQGQRP